MKSNYEEYKNEQMSDPEFRSYYYFAKEKLNLELMIDSIADSIEKEQSKSTLKRKVSELRNYVATLSL